MAAAWLVGLGGGGHMQRMASADRSTIVPQPPRITGFAPAPSSSPLHPSPSALRQSSGDADDSTTRLDGTSGAHRKRRASVAQADEGAGRAVGRKTPRTSAIEMSRVDSAAPSDAFEDESTTGMAELGVEAERNAAKPKREDYDVPRGQFHRLERIRMNLSVPDPAWPSPPARKVATREHHPATLEPFDPPPAPLRAPEWQPTSLLSMPTPADQRVRLILAARANAAATVCAAAASRRRARHRPEDDGGRGCSESAVSLRLFLCQLVRPVTCRCVSVSRSHAAIVCCRLAQCRCFCSPSRPLCAGMTVVLATTPSLSPRSRASALRGPPTDPRSDVRVREPG